MPVSLAPSASASASSDVIGASAAGLLFGAPASDGFCDDMYADSDPVAGRMALGGALRALSPGDAATVLESLTAQAAALSLVLAADAGGAIRLPDSLRALIESATVLPSFLGGAN